MREYVEKAEAGGRRPSAEERAKESSVFYPVLADVGTTTMLLLFALATGSLTLLSEGIRSILMLAASIYALLVLRAMHRGGLSWFEFGIGKIERFVTVVVGLGLMVSGLWVAQSVINTIFTPGETATPFGLAIAAITNAINTLVNILGYIAMKFASREGDSEVFRVQLRARFIMMVSSLFLQTTLTAAALAKDGGIGLLLDASGATFVAGLMVYNGFGMMSRAVPDLLDAQPPPVLRALIHRAVASVLPEEEVVRVRTRRLGAQTFAEVAVRGGFCSSVASLHKAGTEIATALRDEGKEVEVAVVLASQRRPVGVS